jgi:hypothetical protein
VAREVRKHQPHYEPGHAAREIAAELLKENIFTPDQHELFMQLRYLQDFAVDKGDAAIKPKDAIHFIQIALDLTAYLKARLPTATN